MTVGISLGTMAETGTSVQTSLSVTTPALSTGDVHVIAVDCLATTPTFTGTPAGYTLYASIAALGATSNAAGFIYTRQGPASSGTATFTFSGSQTGRIAAIPYVITGADTTTPLVASPAADSSGFVGDTLTPVPANSYLMCVYFGRGPASDPTPFTFTPPSGMTEIAEKITTTSSGSQVAVEVCGLQLASNAATGNKTATIGTGSAPGHGGISFLINTGVTALPNGGGLPALEVLLDDGTGAFPYDVTTYTRLTEGSDIGRGRSDELTDVSPGECSLRLENNDGRFTPGSTILGTPSPIVADQRIKVRSTVGATTVDRFTGYVQSWPISWEGGSDLSSRVSIGAIDAQARAERRTLRSMLEEEILGDDPVAYYTLGEAEGAAGAGDTSGNQAPVMATTGTGSPVVFGSATGPGTDGLTAATFAGGQYLSAVLQVGSAGRVAMACTVLRTGVPSTPEHVIGFNGGPLAELVIETDGKLSLYATGSLMARTTSSICDGLTHGVLFQYTASFASLYLDGSLVGSTAAGLPMTFSSYLMTIGGSTSRTALTGVISHAVCWQTAGSLDPARYWSAASTGFAGESGTARITRIAGYANLPVGTLDASLTNVAFVDITGQSAADVIRDVADAEGGLVFFNGSGNLTFHNRARPVAKTTPDITIDANYLAEDTSFAYDMQGVINHFEVTAAGTGAAQVAENATSEATHGRYPSSKSYLVQTDAEALDRGNWIVGTHGEPQPRAGQIKIDILTMSAADREAMLAVEPNTWIRITNLPATAPTGTTADFMVQGWTETLNINEWSLSCNVVSKSLFSAWILGDPVYGALGAYPLFY